MTSWAVGVDLSLTSTAVAALDVESGELFVHRIKSKGTATDSLHTKLGRYRLLSEDIAKAAVSVKPTVVAIEGAQFATSKDTSAHRRAGVWWRVCDLIESEGIPVIEVPPTTLKKWGTGKGNAGKDMVLAAAVRRWPDVITQNDEADAAWLSDISAYVTGASLVTKTKARDAILSKLDLSDLSPFAKAT